MFGSDSAHLKAGNLKKHLLHEQMSGLWYALEMQKMKI